MAGTNSDMITHKEQSVAWKLTPLRGAVEPVILGQETIVFGRHPENAVVLDDDMCSRKHCELTFESGQGYIVKDLGSPTARIDH